MINVISCIALLIFLIYSLVFIIHETIPGTYFCEMNWHYKPINGKCPRCLSVVHRIKGYWRK